MNKREFNNDKIASDKKFVNLKLENKETEVFKNSSITNSQKNKIGTSNQMKIDVNSKCDKRRRQSDLNNFIDKLDSLDIEPSNFK